MPCKIAKLHNTRTYKENVRTLQFPKKQRKQKMCHIQITELTDASDGMPGKHSTNH